MYIVLLISINLLFKKREKEMEKECYEEEVQPYRKTDYKPIIYIYIYSVVNVYLDHLKLCVVCIYGRIYVCCGECNIVSNECDEPTLCLVQPIGAQGGEIMYFGTFCFRGELVFLKCDDIAVLAPQNGKSGPYCWGQEGSTQFAQQFVRPL